MGYYDSWDEDDRQQISLNNDWYSGYGYVPGGNNAPVPTSPGSPGSGDPIFNGPQLTGQGDWSGGEGGINIGNYSPFYDERAGAPASPSSGHSSSRFSAAPRVLNMGTSATSTQMPITPTAPAPVFPTLPHFKMPEYDRGRVEAIAQRVAAPEIRRLRNQIQKAAAMGYDNPNVRAHVLRQAMEGYGMGLENTMRGARSAAVQEYGAVEYGPKVQETQMNWQTQTNQLMGEFNALWQAWMKGFGAQTTSTSTPSYGVVDGSKVSPLSGGSGAENTFTVLRRHSYV